MFIRVVHSCVGLEHVMHEDARYKMIYHPHDQENAINSNRFAKLIHAADRQYKDGYNNINYKVVSVEKKEKIYTNITIDVGTPEMEKIEKQEKLKAELINGEKSIDDNSAVDEEFEVSMQAIILTIVFIIYSLYKSRIIHYCFKQQTRQLERKYSSRKKTIGKKYTPVINDSSSETETTDTVGNDEKPLLKSGTRKTRHHSRSQSVPYFNNSSIEVFSK